MKSLPIALVAALSGCGAEPAKQRPADAAPITPPPSGPPMVQKAQPRAKSPGLETGNATEGAAQGLRIDNPDGTLRMSVACTGNPARLVATVPSFTPIASEDRFALAVGQEPVTLVTDPTRQRIGAGVSAEGPVPENFAASIAAADQVGALYGTQKIGPHSLSRESASRLLRECGKA